MLHTPIFIDDEIQVKYLLIQTNIQVGYKTTYMATKCQRKENSLSVSKGNRPVRCWNLKVPLED